MDKIIKQEVERIKSILKKEKEPEDVHNALEVIYQRISNRDDDKYSNKYDFIQIMRSDTVKELSKKYKGKRYILFEFVKFDKAPNGVIIIYNEADEVFWNRMDLYITKI